MESFITEKSWREEGKPGDSARRPPYLRRAIFVTVTLALLALFGVMLIKPLQHPNTHLVLMQGGTHRPLTAKRAPLSYLDADRIQSLRPATVQQQVADFSGLLRSPLALRKLEGNLRRLGIGDSDVLILYVSAHGISYQGTAYLLSDSFDPARPQEGRIPLSSLLSQIGAISAKTKLLILEAGSLDYDPRLGVIVNEFPRLLQEAVTRKADPSLWVLLSHSEFEQSQVSLALKGSVFGVFVERGLGGAADVDQNQVVDLRELAGFVRSHVTSWVNQRTGGTESQTPTLTWSGGDVRDSDNPQLLAVGQFPPESRRVDVRELVGANDSTAALAASLDLADPRLLPRGVLSRKTSPTNPADLAAENVATNDDEAKPGSPQGTASGANASPSQPAASAEGNESRSGSAEQPVEATSDSATIAPESLALLIKAWRFRDELSPPRAHSNLIDSFPDQFPHLWRELQSELIEFERSLNNGDASGAAFARSKLERGLAEIQDLSSPESASNPPDQPQSDVSDSAILLNDLDGRTWTLPLTELLAPYGGTQMSLPVQELRDAIKQDSDEAFRNWMQTSWQDRYHQFYELRLAKQLAELDSIDWQLLRVALRVRLLGEQISARSLGTVHWVERQILEADRLRLAGERQIFDRIGYDWKRNASKYLQAAIDSYGAAAEDIAELERSIALRNRLVSRAPYYVQWHHATAGDNAYPTPQFGELKSFLDTLIQFSKSLASPAGSSIRRLAELRRKLVAQSQQIEIGCSDAFIDDFTNGVPSDGDARRIERLLETPLPTSLSRWKLLVAANNFSTDLALSYTLPVAFDVSPQTLPAGRSADQLDDWVRRFQQAQLEMALVELASWPSRDLDSGLAEPGTEGDAREFVASHHQAVQEGFARVAAAHATAGGQLPKSSDQLHQAYRILGAALAEFYAELGRPIVLAEASSAAMSHDAANQKMVAGVSALSMLDARDAWQYRDTSVRRLSVRVDLFELLKFHQRRFALAATLSPVEEANYLATAAKDYGHYAAEILNPRQPGTGSLLAVSAPLSVSLLDRSRGNVRITIANNSSSAASAWVVLQYDPELLVVTSPAEVYHQHRLGGIVAETLRSIEIGTDQSTRQTIAGDRPARPDNDLADRERAESVARDGLRRFRLLPGDTVINIPVTLSRRRVPATSTGLLVKVISGPALPTPGVERRMSTLFYDRRKIAVQLPAVDVTVDANEHTWTSSGDELTLHPFPNRVTNYRLKILQDQQRARRSMSTCMRSMTSRPSQHGTAIVTRCRRRRKLVHSDSILKPIRNPRQLLTRQPLHHPIKRTRRPNRPRTKGSRPSGQLATHGLLLVLTNQDSGEKTVKYVGFVPQRPRRYVVPVVAYNSERQRIEVRVTARDEQLLPDDNVVVNCRIAEDSELTYPGKLRGEIDRTRQETNLYVSVPSIPPQRITLYLDVDEYPRSFVYQVWCGRDTRSIPEESTLLTARIVPPPEDFLRGPLSELPVTMEVDAPIGSFETSSDTVRLRLESDEPDAASANPWVELSTDRNVQMFVDSVAADGTIAVRAQVQDFQLSLPSGQLSNVRARVSADLVASNRRRSLTLARFGVDSAPPMVERIGVRPHGGVVISGRQLDVTVRATDQMSGVREVAVGFEAPDADPASVQLVAALPVSDDTWTVTLPTEGVLGAQRILVRAIDRVGNSAERRQSVNIVTPELMKAFSQGLAVRLTGQILYAKKPVVNASVTLVREDEGEPRIQRTDEQGIYAFDRVTAGEYELFVRGVVRNVPRISTTKLAVEPSPGDNKRLNIELD